MIERNSERVQIARCALCDTRVNLATQKLVTVQWVDADDGTLCSLNFHHDCYHRWSLQMADMSRRERRQLAAPKSSEKPLTEEELRRLEFYRRIFRGMDGEAV